MSVRCKECGAVAGHGVELGHRIFCPKWNKICYACCPDNHLNRCTNRVEFNFCDRRKAEPPKPT